MVSEDNDKRRKSGAKISRSPLLIKKGGGRNGLMEERGQLGDEGESSWFSGAA